MPTTTTNYALNLPTVGSDDDQWGSYLNTNFTKIDTQLKTLNDSIADQDLEELGNVVNTTPAEDQVLQFNGQNWSASTLSISDISGLQTALDGKADDSDLTGITTNPADGSISYTKLNTALQVQVDRILLTDDDATPTDNQILKYSATDAEWKYADLPGSTIQTLSDVNSSSLADDAVLVYNATAGEFQFESGATLRTTLGVDVSGTDNSSPVTLSGSLDYLTLSGQAITLQQINLTTDVTDTLPVANGGTGSATASDARIALGLQIGVNTQAFDAGLQSISGLTTAADKMLYTTASDTYAVADLTAAGRAILDDADATAQRTTLGLGALATQSTITESQISDLQSYLTAEANDLSAAVTWANVPDGNITESSVTQHQAALSITESQISDLQSYLTAETNDLSTAVTGTLGTGNGGTGLTAIGTANQVLAVNAGATALEFQTLATGGTVTSVAVSGSDGIEVDSGSPVTSSGTIALGINATSLSTHLGLGTISTQASDSVSITGGSITGVTDIAIADGGTGASTEADARSNLLPSYSGNGSKVLALNSGGTDVEWVTQSQVFTAGIANAFEHPNSVTDSFTVSASDHRFYVGPVSFTNTVTIAGKMLVFDGLYNTTGTINITGTLHVRG